MVSYAFEGIPRGRPIGPLYTVNYILGRIYKIKGVITFEIIHHFGDNHLSIEHNNGEKKSCISKKNKEHNRN